MTVNLLVVDFDRAAVEAEAAQMAELCATQRRWQQRAMESYERAESLYNA